MASPAAKRRRSTTCTITRNPTAGETGITTIVSNLPCTPPYPANREAWELAVSYNSWEIVTNDTALIEDQHVLTMSSGQVFTIERNRRWPGNGRKTGFVHLLVMERDA